MATNFASANYQEVIDLHTESDTTSVIGLHTPNNATPVKMLKGFYEQFRKFKYNGCSISLVPAARLPADPLQVSYEAGEPTIDPRDMLNPILFKGCHGNDMGSILNQMYSGTDLSASAGQPLLDRETTDSVDVNVMDGDRVGNTFLEQLYYKALVDKTWLKAHPQRGFRKSGLHPMVYSLATNHQLSHTWGNSNPPYGPTYDAKASALEDDTEVTYNGGYNVGSNAIRPTQSASSSIVEQGVPAVPEFNTSDNKIYGYNDFKAVQFFTPRLTKLGWMDTGNVLGNYTATTNALNGDEAHDRGIINALYDNRNNWNVNLMPKIFMGMIMLPPAYKTEQYYRLVINHSFSFKGFRGASQMPDDMVVNGFGVGNDGPVFNLN